MNAYEAIDYIKSCRSSAQFKQEWFDAITDELDRKDAKIEELKKDRFGVIKDRDEIFARAEKFRKSLLAMTADMKDAERYRAAFDESIETVEIRVWVGSENNGGWEYPRSKDECDRAIDAAMDGEE